MKRRIITYLICLPLLCLFSCEDVMDDIIKSKSELCSLKIQFMFDEDVLPYLDSIGNFTVEFHNINKNYTFSCNTDSNFIINIDSLERGIYSYATTNKQDIDETYYLVSNGTGSITLTENIQDSCDVVSILVNKKGSGFIIREYYYSGSTTEAGKHYSSDQYVEIYNNSSDTLMADSLIFVELASYATSQNYWNDIQEDTMVVRMIWSLPESQDGYPVPPGSGIILARDAMNHKSDSLGNPNSPVDLLNADFEFWSDKTTDGDIDFPATNLIDNLWTYKGSDIAFHTRGGSAIAIVKIPGDIDEYINKNLTTKASENNRYYCKIPNDYVIDAVEAIWNDSRKANKRIGLDLDAGITYIEAGPYTGLCVRRDIDMIFNGRTIYKDTNNSTEDFLHDVTPMPKIYDEE